MKKLICLYALLLIAMTGSAQTVRFAYLSVDSVMQSMSEYADIKKEIAELRRQYEAEQQRVEDDFNKKFEDFLDGQASFPKTILQKRQSELQSMLDKNIAFKHESQKLLKEAEEGLINGIRDMINAALKIIGQERGYAFVINTDADSTPFINPAMGDDITKDVKEMLK